MTAGLQQPWDNAVEPDDKSEGWRNRVRGQGHAAFLMQGIPEEGLPEEIYDDPLGNGHFAAGYRRKRHDRTQH